MKRLLLSLLLAVSAAVFQTIILTSEWGNRAELWAIDRWFHLRGEIPAPQDVAILSMDEQSYKNLDIPMNQAWPRGLHALMFKKLAALGAKRAVMDIVFAGPGADPEIDKDLSQSMALLPTVLGADTGSRSQGAGASSYTIEELIEPAEIFAQSAEAIALVKMPDDGGVLRRFDLPRSHTTAGFPTLYEAAVGKNHNDPGLPGPRDMLWYYGLPGAIPTYSYQMILDDEHPLPLKDKIVFVGLNLRTGVGPMEKDSYSTPFYERAMFGIEIQATAAANLLENRWIKRSSHTTEAIAIFIASFVLVFLLGQVKPQWGALLSLGSAILWGVIAYNAFKMGYFIPGITLVGGTVPLCFSALTLAHYLVTYRAQQQVEKAFRLYLPPEMAREMRTNKKALELGGQDLIGTAFFTDIADFTRISENLSASDAAHMLNKYFTQITSVIFDHRGTLIKFIGDAVFVIWGAPIRITNHAELACRTALDMQKAVDEFNARGEFPALHTRIGVNTGHMLVGNLGSNLRFDYTAVGDTINLTSRLEGSNKYFGTDIIVSESSAKEIPADLHLLKLGAVKVTGKTENVGIYTLLDTPLPTEITTLWESGLSAFEMRAWNDSFSAFNKIISKADHLGKASALYLKVIAEYQKKPPEPDWKGELTLLSK